MEKNNGQKVLYYPRKMRTGWCVAHEVTAAGVTIERYGIKCRSDEPGTIGGNEGYRGASRGNGCYRISRFRYGKERAAMSEKVSTLTLRLTAEEAAQLEILKDITGIRSGSEAIKHVVKEYPRFCAHYKQEAREKGELQRKYQEQQEAVTDFLNALGKLQQATGTKDR